ncbi:hypothetical protein FB565_001749 [Actinoplanes lutulentus]|nr:hypothetical protein [Actinoplanes lutulentus]
MRLQDDRRARRIHSGGQQDARLFQCESTYSRGFVIHRHRVQVRDHRDRIGVVLRGDQRAQSAQQIAEMQVTGGLETGQAPGECHESSLRGYE